MFISYALTALFALATSNFVAADVTPSEPGPGTVSNAGTPCRIVWKGDTLSTTDWKNMAIELMTGSNFDMVHITTVATNQDGTTDGLFTYPCPAVTPNSAIYFYQFSSSTAANRTWTTRFAIASTTGQTTPPANAIQPTSNDPIPWGTGALVDPSTAVPPPSFVGDTGANNGVGPGSGNTTSISASLSSTISSSSSISNPASSTPVSSSLQKVNAVSSAASSSASSATTAKETNAARGMIVTDRHLWQSLAVLGASAMAFTVLL